MDLPKVLTSLFCCVALFGCSLVPLATDREDNDVMRLIATDLVSTLVQVRSIPVRRTTLNLPVEQFSGGSFATALQEQLELAGYAIRTVGSNPADRLVSYSVELDEGGPDSGAVSTYTVTIGSVSVRRKYANVDSDKVYPTEAMQVNGADANTLKVSKGLFNEPVHTAEIDRESSAVSTAADTIKQSGALSTASSATEQGAGMRAATLIRLQDRPIDNFRELKRSNFSDFLDKLSLVKETILPFGNDSIELDTIAREEIARFAEAFKAESDVFSVIGCSNGATASVLGPKGLAMGRAGRVTAELKRNGVPAQSILEEGCWGGEHFDEMMPRRGVVLTLQRITSSSDHG